MPLIDDGAKASSGSPFLVQRQNSNRMMPSMPSEPARAPSLQHSPSQQPHDLHLFDSPSDLICPITCELFRDPVISPVGQVYERAAIERHFSRSATGGQPVKDPVTNQVLDSLALVPVYAMRSRAAEYRERTARACVEAAVSPTCGEPVKYLRRAAELLAPQVGAASPGQGSPQQTHSQPQSFIPGISREFANFLSNHQGEAYNAMALKYFGNELLRAGASDAAADVFYRLLLEAEDKQQQFEYLQLCLACWSSTNSKHHTNAAPAAASTQATTAATTATSSSSKSQEGCQTEDGVGLDEEVISKLAAFVERQQCLSMGSIIDMLATARVGQTASLRLCNTLLSRAVAGIGPLSDSISDFSKIVDLLMRCIQLNQQQSEQQVQHLSEQLQSIAAAAAATAGTVASSAGAAGGVSEGGDASATGAEGTQTQAGARQSAEGNSSSRGRGSKPGKSQRTGPGSKNKPLHALGAAIRGKVARRVATAALAAVSLTGRDQLVWRAARLAPLLLLLSNKQ